MERTEFFCPRCAQRLTADVEMLAREARCPRCSSTLRPIDALDLDHALPVIAVEDEPLALVTPNRSAQDEMEEREPPPSDALGLEIRAALGEATEHDAMERSAPDTSPRRAEADGAPTSVSAPRARVFSDLAALSDELVILADRLVRSLDRGVADRSRRAALALSALAFALLVALASSDATGWRWFCAAAGCAASASAIVVAAAVALSRRRRQPAGPVRRWLASGAVAAAVGMAALPTAIVATASSPARAPARGSASGASDAPVAAATAPASPGPTAGPRASSGGADAELARDAQERLMRGVYVYVPPTFHSGDGAFNAVMHFHGNRAMVEQSVVAAELNALVVVINLERGRDYWKRFAAPASFRALLDDLRAHAEERGLAGARLRRVALSSWSAGSGALTQILSRDNDVDEVDAVLVLEGLHVSWFDKRRTRVDPNKIGPFVRFARRAMEREKLFVITHSSAKTEDYADARTVSDGVLEAVGLNRVPAEGAVPPVTLEAAKALQHPAPQWLEAESVAGGGDFHVLGYRGRTHEHYRAHLVQMSRTVLPLLRARWRR